MHFLFIFFCYSYSFIYGCMHSITFPLGPSTLLSFFFFSFCMLILYYTLPGARAVIDMVLSRCWHSDTEDWNILTYPYNFQYNTSGFDCISSRYNGTHAAVAIMNVIISQETNSHAWNLVWAHRKISIHPTSETRYLRANNAQKCHVKNV